MALLKINAHVATPTDWTALVQDDLVRLEAKMLEASHMGHETLDAAVELLIRSGGKRVRPIMALLTGRLFDADLEAVLPVAASVELLHTATLVHDDLIDGATERSRERSGTRSWHRERRRPNRAAAGETRAAGIESTWRSTLRARSAVVPLF